VHKDQSTQEIEWITYPLLFTMNAQAKGLPWTEAADFWDPVAGSIRITVYHTWALG